MLAVLAFCIPAAAGKLHWNLRLEIVERHSKMLLFWRQNGFEDESAWLKLRLDTLRSAAEKASK